jgi:hypothetical protein
MSVEWLRLVGAWPMLGKRVDVVIEVDLNLIERQGCLMMMVYELRDIYLVTPDVCMAPWRIDMLWVCDATRVVAQECPCYYGNRLRK